MAYIQKPGRGNSPKTGNGLPSALKQIDPEVATKASAKIHKELNVDPMGKANQFQAEYDDKTGFKGKATNIENIMSGDNINRVQGGKTIATISKNDKVGAKKFMVETEKMVADQGFRRNKTAQYLNKRKESADINYKK